MVVVVVQQVTLWVPDLGTADTGEPDSTTPHHPILGRGPGSLDNGGWGLRGACSLSGHSTPGLESREQTPSSSVSSLSPTRQRGRAWWEKHQGTRGPLLSLHSCGSKGQLGSLGGVLLPAKNHAHSADCSRKLSALPPMGSMVSAQYQGPAICRQIV